MKAKRTLDLLIGSTAMILNVSQNNSDKIQYHMIQFWYNYICNNYFPEIILKELEILAKPLFPWSKREYLFANPIRRCFGFSTCPASFVKIFSSLPTAFYTQYVILNSYRVYQNVSISQAKQEVFSKFKLSFAHKSKTSTETASNSTN